LEKLIEFDTAPNAQKNGDAHLSGHRRVTYNRVVACLIGRR
jgi:hypothetical protein